MELGILVLGLLVACVILATISLILSIINTVMILAREKATHTVQLMPVDAEIDRANEDFLNANRKSGWASSDEAIKKENDSYREEVESSMPEFALDDV